MAAKGNLTEAGLAQIAALADGNGIDGRKVKLVNAKEGIARVRGQTLVQVSGKVSTRTQPGEAPPQAAYCGSRHDWHMRARTASEEAAQDPQLREQLAAAILGQPNSGWAYQTDKLKLPATILQFAFTEACEHCHGQGMTVCPRCRGEGELPCQICRSQGRVQCTTCNGVREVQTPAGKRPCNTCQGTGEMACETCRGKMRIQCEVCHGRQQIGCDTCQRNGRFTHIADINLVGRTRFRLAMGDLPPPLQKVLKTEPPSVIDSQQADIEVVHQGVTREGLVVEYAATLPVAQLQLAIGKNKLPVVVFGKKHRLGAVPYFLDKMIAPGVKALEQAATGKGNVAENIRQGARFKLLKLAVVQSLAGNPAVPQYLLRRYPHGLSPKLAQQIDRMLHTAFLHITKHPRMRAVLATTLVLPLASLGLYMTPVRDILIKVAGHPGVGWGFDAGLPVVWIVLSLLATRYVSGRALELTLPQLFNEAIEAAYENASSTHEDDTGRGASGQVLLAGSEQSEEEEVKTTKGKTGSLFMIALIGIPLLHLAAIVGAALLGGAQPDWLGMIRQMAGF